MNTVPDPDSRIVLSVSGAHLVAPVLGRVISMLAARAQCPIDRLDDAMLLSDALAAHAPRFAKEGWITFTVETTVESLRLQVGPLPPGGAEELVKAAQLPGVGNVFERVADGVTTESHPEGDTLNIALGFGR